MLPRNSAGGYRFIPAPGSPFSFGIVADPGLDLVRARFGRPMAIGQALELAALHLHDAGRPTAAIAGFELRIPRPLTNLEWEAFNRGYVSRLEPLGLKIGGVMGPARTNVAPVGVEVAEPSVYAFTYTAPGSRDGVAFILAGVPESEPGDPAHNIDSIVRVLTDRMRELGVTWPEATAVQLYGIDNVQDLLVERVLSLVGTSAVHGIHWFPSRPPIEGLRLEIDVRSIGTELVLP